MPESNLKPPTIIRRDRSQTNPDRKKEASCSEERKLTQKIQLIKENNTPFQSQKIGTKTLSQPYPSLTKAKKNNSKSPTKSVLKLTNMKKNQSSFVIGCDGEAAILLTEGTNHQFMLLSENEEEFLSSIDDRGVMYQS
jgi:hypothetical protein